MKFRSGFKNVGNLEKSLIKTEFKKGNEKGEKGGEKKGVEQNDRERFCSRKLYQYLYMEFHFSW